MDNNNSQVSDQSKARFDPDLQPVDPENLLVAQMALLCQQTPIALLGSMVSAVLVWFFTRDVVDPMLLGLWVGTICLISGYRLLEIKHYKRVATSEGVNTGLWSRRFIFWALVTGVMWGSLAVFIYPSGSFTHQMFMIFLIGGLGAGSVATYSPFVVMNYVFIIPAMLPFVVRFMMEQQPLYTSSGSMVLFFMLLLLLAAKRMNHSIIVSLKSSIQKDRLVQYMEHAMDETDKLNRKLQTEINERNRLASRLRVSEKEFSNILLNVQDTIYRIDEDSKLVWVSPSAKSLTGYSVDELIGTEISELYAHPEKREEFIELFERQDGKVSNFQLELKRKDGVVLWVSVNAHYYFDNDGHISGIEGLVSDISSLKKAEKELQNEKERAEVTLNSIGDGVITTNIQGQVEYMNPVAERLSGWKLDEAINRKFTDIIHLVDEESHKDISDPVSRSIQLGHMVRATGNTLLVNRNGDKDYSVEVTVSPIRNAHAITTGTVIGIHDVTNLRSLARQMSYQATHDSLTGLINRREFETLLGNLLYTAKSGEGREHALCYLDLDQFKVVNDTCGHVAGDELLRQLATKLHEIIRESDSLARLGGDEFGVLLDSCPINKAIGIAEQLRKAVKNFHFVWQEKPFEIGVSIGVVPINRGSGSMTDVLRAADTACYVSKENGRNRLHLYQPDDRELVRHHGEMQWVHRINKALEENRFLLYSQKIVPLSEDGGTNHNEILLRMVDEQGEIVSPGEFIPAAERYHMMPAIDSWVVRNTFRALCQSLRGDRAKEMFTINLSGQSLCENEFLNFVVSEIDSSGVDSELICFEITESAAISNLNHATRFMNVMKGMGCQFALDDFGSGLCSFSYLKNLNVDYLKIDGSYVSDIVDDAVDYAMVESINQIGHALGMVTIAEFVDSAAVVDKLKQLGVDYAQGFHLDQPKPLLKELTSQLLDQRQAI